MQQYCMLLVVCSNLLLSGLSCIIEIELSDCVLWLERTELNESFTEITL